MNSAVEMVQLACGVCGETLSRQIRAHALEVDVQHPCTINRMRSVMTQYERRAGAWHSRGSPQLL